MGMRRTCKKGAYASVKTKRGTELRCTEYSNKRGKAPCDRRLRGGARSPGLIHKWTCPAPGMVQTRMQKRTKRYRKRLR